MTAHEAPVVRREEVAPGHHLIELECPQVADNARPGQFVHVRVAGTNDPLLRRPLSIMLCDRTRGRFQLLVRKVGRGTELLAQTVPGNVLDVIGPLGQGFPFPPPGQEALLVAGGVGVAPLIFLADELQMSPEPRYVRGLFGAATEEGLVCWQELAERCEEFEAATEDGTAGTHGVVTDLLERRLGRVRVDNVYTCGPRAMMAKVARLCEAAGVPCWVSLEQFMGCGIGACLACVVPTTTPSRSGPCFVRVCADGPVFPASQIAWEEMDG